MLTYRFILLPRPDLTVRDQALALRQRWRRTVLALDAVTASLACLIVPLVFGGAMPILAAAMLPAIWVGVLSLGGCYRDQAILARRPACPRVFMLGPVLVFPLAVLFASEHTRPMGWPLVLMAALIGLAVCLATGAGRRLHALMVRRQLEKGRGLVRAVVMGSADEVSRTVCMLDDDPRFGLVAVGALLPVLDLRDRPADHDIAHHDIAHHEMAGHELDREPGQGWEQAGPARPAEVAAAEDLRASDIQGLLTGLDADCLVMAGGPRGSEAGRTITDALTGVRATLLVSRSEGPARSRMNTVRSSTDRRGSLLLSPQ